MEITMTCNWRTILSWEVASEDPSNPNRYAIEAIKEEIGTGVYVKTYEELVEYFKDCSINVHSNILDALLSFSKIDNFMAYIIYYTPKHNSRKVYLEICGAKQHPSVDNRVGFCTDPLRIY